MEAQRDLVDVVHTLRQVVCVRDNRGGLKGPLHQSGCRVAATHMSWAHVHAGSTPATRTSFHSKGWILADHLRAAIHTSAELEQVEEPRLRCGAIACSSRIRTGNRSAGAFHS